MSVIKKAFLLGISTLVLLVFCMGAFMMPKTAKATQIVLPEIVNASFEQAEPCGSNPEPPALGAQHLSHWTTREVQLPYCF